MTSKTKKQIKAILIVAIIWFIILGIFFLPVIKGNYRYRKFINTINEEMDRKQIHTIAKKIGYYDLDIIIDNRDIIMSNNYKVDIELNRVSDRFYFNNFIQYTTVFISYDKNGTVDKIRYPE